jgi:hypothetical protein
VLPQAERVRPLTATNLRGMPQTVFAEADGYAHEPWCRVAEHLGHRTGVGTGELNPLPVGRGVKPPSDTLMGK